jgi:hypothetical protein
VLLWQLPVQRRVLLYYIIEIMTAQRFHRRPLLRFAYFRDGKRETEQQVMQRPASYVGPRIRQENATALSESKLPSRMPPSSSHPCTKCHADPTSRLLITRAHSQPHPTSLPPANSSLSGYLFVQCCHRNKASRSDSASKKQLSPHG